MTLPRRIITHRRRHDPALPVIRRRAIPPGTIPAGVAVRPKPFDLDPLLTIVDQALGGDHPG
jgi:hypothetical protein